MTNHPLIFELGSRTSGGYEVIPRSSRQDSRQKRRRHAILSGFLGNLAGRAWHGQLIAGKIGVLNSVKDASASKEFL
jgi:hypothetical protein